MRDRNMEAGQAPEWTAIAMAIMIAVTASGDDGGDLLAMAMACGPHRMTLPHHSNAGRRTLCIRQMEASPGIGLRCQEFGTTRQPPAAPMAKPLFTFPMTAPPWTGGWIPAVRSLWGPSPDAVPRLRCREAIPP